MRLNLKLVVLGAGLLFAGVAEAGVERVQSDTRARMMRATDPYLRERLHDLDDLANRLMHQLLLLSAEDKRADISLWINSPGGSVSAMLAIRDVMRLIPNDVATLAMGMAASAGQFLLSAGTPGKRHALPHARILLHQGSAGIGGTAMDIEIQAKEIVRMRELLDEILAFHTGQALDRVSKDTDRDFIMSGIEAKDYGIVDEILTNRELAAVPSAEGTS